MKWICSLLGLLTLAAVSAMEPGELIYGTDARDSSKRPVRILETIRTDGTGRRPLLSPDFIGENFWPGYRGAGPVQFDSPDVSPVGKQILFTNTYNLYAMDWDGGPVFSLTRFIREKYQPRWSPDGKRIVFVSDRNSNCEIYVMNADGTGIRNISWSPQHNLSPCWSPDGKQVAFIRGENGRFDLWVSDDQGIRQRKILSLSGDIREPDWSVSGRIVFSTQLDSGAYAVMSVKPDGSGLKKYFETPVWSGHPAWSPSGKQIAYSSVRSGNADIWIFDLETGRHRNVTVSPAKQDFFPRWVPKQLPGRPQAWTIDREALADAKLTDEGRTGKVPVKCFPALIPQPKLPRPRLLFTASGLPAIRERLGREPYKTFWQRMLKQCDAWLKSPQIDASLDRIPTDPLRKRYEIQAFAELYNRELWLEALMKLAFARQVTGNEKYGRRAVEILLAAAERYRRAYGLMHSDYRVACAYDWLYDLIPEAERASMNVLLKASMEAKKMTCLYYTTGIYGSSPGAGNYPIYFAASLGPIAFALLGEPGISDDFELTAERLALITLNTWISPEGDAQEGFSYFNHPVNELMPFLISLHLQGRCGPIRQSNLKNVFRWMAVSSGKGCSETPALGDSDYLAMPMPAGLLALYPDDPLLRKVWNRVPRKISELTSVTGLLWWEPSQVREQDWGELPAGMVFQHSGYAVLRAGSRYADPVMTVSAPRHSGHAHLEYGAVTLSAGGLRLLADPGQAVPMSEYHSQLLVNGRGRERSNLKQPMLAAVRKDARTVSVPVDFTNAFALSFFGAPGYSGIPCGRPGLISGRRIVTLVKASDGIPPYFLISDRVRTERRSEFEQLFTADQGMTVTAEKDGSLRIGEMIRKPVFRSTRPDDAAEWTVSAPIRMNSCYVHVFARSSAPVELEINGKKYNLTFLQTPSRPETWQWRKLRLKRDFFRIPADFRKPCRIVLKSRALIYCIAFSNKPDLDCHPDAAVDALPLRIAEARRTGSGWKTFQPSDAFLRLIPLAGKPEAAVTRRIFNTRFHGQLRVVLPQGIFRQSGKTGEFLTMAYPASADMEQPRIGDHKLEWKSCIDEITVDKDQIKVRRIGK